MAAVHEMALDHLGSRVFKKLDNVVWEQCAHRGARAYFCGLRSSSLIKICAHDLTSLSARKPINAIRRAPLKSCRLSNCHHFAGGLRAFERAGFAFARFLTGEQCFGIWEERFETFADVFPNGRMRTFNP